MSDFSKTSLAIAEAQQKRMKIVGEAVNGIQAIKLFAWEKSIANCIGEFRQEELHHVRKWNFKIAQIMALIMSTTTVITIVTFFSYSIQGHELRADVILPTIYVIEMLRWPFFRIASSVSLIASGMESIKRVEHFLLTKEVSIPPWLATVDTFRNEEKLNRPIQKKNSNGQHGETNGFLKPHKTVIELNRASFSWDLIGRWEINKCGQEECIEKTAESTDIDESVLDTSKIVHLPMDNNGHDFNDESRLSFISSEFIRSDSNICMDIHDPEGFSTQTQNSLSFEHVNGNQDFVSHTCSSPKVTLQDITLSIREGEMIAIVGKIGAGKSSLISALLGEVPLCSTSDTNLSHSQCLSERIFMQGAPALVTQRPWVRNGTIRENIVCGHKWDETKYDQVIDACCLKTDLDLLPFGDETEIGERGVNLSGGQKQRINLARAVYSDKDIYLLDDPLSAVDASIGQKIFTNCLLGPLLQYKTRILVTHQLQFLPLVDRIIIMEHSSIKCIGSWSELKEKGVAFMSLIGEIEEFETHKQMDSEKKDCAYDGEGIKNKNTHVSLTNLTKQEERYSGTVGSHVYYSYFRFIGGWRFLLSFFFISILLESSTQGVKMWLTYWSAHKNIGAIIGLGVFAGLGVSQVGLVLSRNYWWFHTTFFASKRLHKDMLKGVLLSPLTFFQSTPQVY